MASAGSITIDLHVLKPRTGRRERLFVFLNPGGKQSTALRKMRPIASLRLVYSESATVKWLFHRRGLQCQVFCQVSREPLQGVIGRCFTVGPLVGWFWLGLVRAEVVVLIAEPVQPWLCQPMLLLSAACACSLQRLVEAFHLALCLWMTNGREMAPDALLHQPDQKACPAAWCPCRTPRNAMINQYVFRRRRRQSLFA